MNFLPRTSNHEYSLYEQDQMAIMDIHQPWLERQGDLELHSQVNSCLNWRISSEWTNTFQDRNDSKLRQTSCWRKLRYLFFLILLSLFSFFTHFLLFISIIKLYDVSSRFDYEVSLNEVTKFQIQREREKKMRERKREREKKLERGKEQVCVE